MSAAPMPVYLSGAAPGPASDDVAVARMTVRGTRVWMAYRPDQQEWRRRHTCGLGPILAWDLLDTLMDFPAGLPVPVAGLGGPVRRRLAAAPAGVVHFGGGRVTRTVVPALTPLLAVLTARDWRAGLAAASRFANYCPRLVVVPSVDSTSEEAVAAARDRGAGLAAGRAGGESVVLEPTPVPDWEPTPAWWRFCEEIYGQAAGAPVRD